MNRTKHALGVLTYNISTTILKLESSHEFNNLEVIVNRYFIFSKYFWCYSNSSRRATILHLNNTTVHVQLDKML